MTVRYDIKQVTRYVLIRRVPTGDTDIAEFKRNDEALKALWAMNAANHPVGDGVTDDTKSFAARNASIRINEDIAIPLLGIDALDTASALDLLETRVAIAKKVWRNHLENRNASAS